MILQNMQPLADGVAGRLLHLVLLPDPEVTDPPFVEAPEQDGNLESSLMKEKKQL
jgi:hypothetical protein